MSGKYRVSLSFRRSESLVFIHKAVVLIGCPDDVFSRFSIKSANVKIVGMRIMTCFPKKYFAASSIGNGGIGTKCAENPPGKNVQKSQGQIFQECVECQEFQECQGQISQGQIFQEFVECQECMECVECVECEN